MMISDQQTWHISLYMLKPVVELRSREATGNCTKNTPGAFKDGAFFLLKRTETAGLRSRRSELLKHWPLPSPLVGFQGPFASYIFSSWQSCRAALANLVIPWFPCREVFSVQFLVTNWWGPQSAEISCFYFEFGWCLGKLISFRKVQKVQFFQIQQEQKISKNSMKHSWSTDLWLGTSIDLQWHPAVDHMRCSLNSESRLVFIVASFLVVSLAATGIQSKCWKSMPIFNTPFNAWYLSRSSIRTYLDLSKIAFLAHWIAGSCYFMVVGIVWLSRSTFTCKH